MRFLIFEALTGVGHDLFKSLGRYLQRDRVADAMLCVHGVALGKEPAFLYPAPRALRLVQFYAATIVRGSIIEPILSKIGERELQRSS